MLNNDNFELITGQDWRRGFSNLFYQEHKNWWGTRRWWIQILIWLFIMNGIVALAISGDSDPSSNIVTDGVELIVIFAHVFATFGIIILAQSIIIGEKQSGTAAWILSKPVSRPAFVLSKGLATLISAWIIIIVFQGIVAYLQISLANGSFFPANGIIFGMTVAALHLMFYLSFTLMLGTIFNSRGPVIGLGLGFFIGLQMLGGILTQFAPWIVNILPIDLIETVSTVAGNNQGIATFNFMPVIAMVIWSVIFTSIAIWSFSREEF